MLSLVADTPMVNKKSIPDSLKKASFTENPIPFFFLGGIKSISYVFINQTNGPEEASSRYEKKKTKIPSCEQIKKKIFIRNCELENVNLKNQHF